MWRLALALMVAGAALAYYGWREFRLGRGAGAGPEPITIQELSAGVLDNPWRTLGEHAPVVTQIIITGSRQSDTVEAAYYPVTSADDPALAAALRGDRQFAGTVLVKTHRW